MINWIILLFLGLSLSQENLNLNYESKYGNGTNINDLNQEESPYSYFENLLDINYNYNNIFFYTQLEYSNSPIYGDDKTKIKDLANTYFIEYADSHFMIKYGHIQTLYGYGLVLNMFQDQSTDFDNRIRGIEFRYSPYDMMEVFYIKGSGNYGIKSNASYRSNDLMFGHNLDFLGVQFYTNFGDFLITESKKTTEYSGGIINNNAFFMNSDTRLSKDLQFLRTDFFIDFMNSDDGSSGEFDNLANIDTEVKLNAYNLSYSNTLSIFDIYYEKSINRYNKLLRENDIEDGYYDYISVSSNILGIDFLYEFKDYNMPYYMSVSSNPPLGFMETTSVLMSRNQHSINFSDEIGHQLENRFTLPLPEYFISNNSNPFSPIDILLNLSMGMKHYGVKEEEMYFDMSNGTWGVDRSIYSRVDWNDVIDMNFSDKDLVLHKPFRNFYAEANGWTKNNKFYYKFGYASNSSYDFINDKSYNSFTIPTQFVYGFKNNNSLTIYYEHQKINYLRPYDPDEWEDYYESEKVHNDYLSLSYHISKFGSLTYFYDKESKDSFLYDDFLLNKTNKWTGLELNLELSHSMQLSIFRGSQKGGLVCANGICAVQPSFEDGTKITFRALF